MLEMIGLEKANEILDSNTTRIGSEKVNLQGALERVLSEDIFATINQPPFSRSPLDGYALKSEDTKGADKDKPIALKIVEEIYAGVSPGKKVDKGTAIRIMTGAPIPEGADCVIRQEDTIRTGDKVGIFKQLSQWQNYCFEGEDIKTGELILEKGRLLKSGEIGVLASLGINEIPVYIRPRIGVLSTGDELVDVGDSLSEGQIYNSNLYSISNRIKELGAEPVILGIVEDNENGLADSIREGIKDVDMLITTGGVSVGEKDLLQDVVKNLGAEMLFWRIDLKPGSPALCSTLNGKLIISLSGNPSGATITFELLVRPLLAKLSNREDIKLRWVKAVFVDDFGKKALEGVLYGQTINIRKKV
jgi:molybdopterin molybdotransferase